VKGRGFCYDSLKRKNTLETCVTVYIFRTFRGFPVKEEKPSLWYRLWDHKSEKEKQRLRSLIPWFLYGFAVFYGIIYLSILNTINRDRTGTTVKTWFGGDKPEVVQAREREKMEVLASYDGVRKRVSGGR
jgi:hypothetical protein